LAGISSPNRTIRLAIEKNRHGISDVEFRFQLEGKYFHLRATGVLLESEKSHQR